MKTYERDRLIGRAGKLVELIEQSDDRYELSMSRAHGALVSFVADLEGCRQLLPGGGINLQGLRFGRLVALAATTERRNGSVVWEWQCDCGERHATSAATVLHGGARSCGCLQREGASARLRAVATAHGGSRTPEWRAWRNARRRVTREDHKDWKHYGGRGITMYDEWIDDFAAFLDHVGPKPEPKHLYSLDRIDVNGNYEPGNVRWATRSEQNYNRR